jgi:hypothetical protein
MQTMVNIIIECWNEIIKETIRKAFRTAGAFDDGEYPYILPPPKVIEKEEEKEEEEEEEEEEKPKNAFDILMKRKKN